MFAARESLQLSTQNIVVLFNGWNEDDNFRDRCQKNIYPKKKSYPQYSKQYKYLAINELVFF